MYPNQNYTVHFQNSVEKNVSCFVSSGKSLIYVRSKIFLYICNLRILLFQMIYFWSFTIYLFMVKLAVYEKHFHLTELGGSSLITTLLVNYIEKLNFKTINRSWMSSARLTTFKMKVKVWVWVWLRSDCFFISYPQSHSLFI